MTDSDLEQSGSRSPMYEISSNYSTAALEIKIRLFLATKRFEAK